MIDFKDWSDGWIKPGYYISFYKDRLHYYERVLLADLLHYEWPWSDASDNPASIAALSTSGPVVPMNLVVTRGYDEQNQQNYMWQIIFGIDGQAYIYVELPTDVHRHGIPKVSKPSNTWRAVSHFEEWMSQFREPSFITEHFMMQPDLDRINLEAYNPNDIALTNLKLNFFINAMITERVGTVDHAGSQNPTSARWRETLDQLWKGAKPCRPITLYPVRAPAASP